MEGAHGVIKAYQGERKGGGMEEKGEEGERIGDWRVAINQNGECC